jgi:CubicO group peptidase (beta-lactamase class C family)
MPDRRALVPLVALLVPLVAVWPAAAEEEKPLTPDEEIVRLLTPVREKHKLPGLVGALLRGDRLRAGAVGVRKHGSAEAITVNDLLHVGSCTKPMTATMIATLVEEKKLAWDTKLGEVFRNTKEMHADYKAVTLAQLLTHRAGLPPNGPYGEVARLRSGTEQRRELMRKVLAEPPEIKPGTKYAYSNVGYILAALMAETVTRSSLDALMKERLFQPLGMKSVGYGPPGTRGKLDQPWGHRMEDGSPRPSQEDNWPVMSPAGRAHLTMGDWAKFVGLHLKAAQGEPRLLKEETFKVLHTPPEGQEYAGGWIVVERPWAGGTAFTHGGSNTMWYAVVWVAPKRDFGAMVATNLGDVEGLKAADDALAALIEHALKRAR